MSTAVTPETELHRLECMEIWGGNRAVEDAISVHGIDAWVVSEPHAGAEGGGDVHYVSMCGMGRISRFAVADVAGHGASVNHLAVALRSLMRRNINRVDQTRFARGLNREFMALAKDGVFATAVLATYFTPTDQLITCNAGHPPPLWYRAGERAWQRLVPGAPGHLEEAANLPLGVVEPTPYEQFAVSLEKGDLILIYTDSLIEAMNPQGKPLGEAGLLALARGLDAERPDSLCRSLLQAVTDYRAGTPADDDVTMLLLHHNAADPPRQSLGEMAKVMGKLLGLVKV